METSERLKLPYIMPSQAQKHVTHNEAVRALDTLVQTTVKSRTQTGAPAEPQPVEAYVIPSEAEGVWAGRGNQLAVYQDGAWMYYAPFEGWHIWVEDEGSVAVYSNQSWELLMPKRLQNAETIGVNATANLDARLTSAANETLLTHDGAGHRVYINKANEADTASLIFQTGYSGHAEMGLSGDNDISLKVSADGAIWQDAFKIDANSGHATFSNGLSGAPLAGMTDDPDGAYYVYIDPANGDDLNDGLTAVTAIASLSNLHKLLPMGRRIQIRLLSDVVWDRALQFSYPVAGLEIYGRNADDTDYEIRKISVTDAVNHVNRSGCLELRCLSAVYLYGLEIDLATSRTGSFVRFSSTMGYLRTHDITLKKTGAGNCSLFADGSSFVPSRHVNLIVDPLADGYVARGLASGVNPNDDWRYPSNLTLF